MTRTPLLALPFVCACAAAPAPTRCPAPPPMARAPAPAAEAPIGAPVAELLARLPDGADVLARVDLQRAMDTRVGRIVGPLLVWSTAYARTRAACGERPWEQLRAVEIAYRQDNLTAALLGPVADEGNRCAPAAMSVLSVDDLRAREAGGGVSLVVGQGAAREVLVAARAGEDTAREDEAFLGLSPGLAEPLAVVLVRGRAYRQAVAAINQAADEARREQGAGGRALPPLELASDAMLDALRGARIEVGLTAAGDLDLRMSLLFRAPEDAQRYIAASEGDVRERVPAYLAEIAVREMRDNPDAQRAVAGLRQELGAWMMELAPLSQHGAVVEFRTGVGGTGTVAALGALSAIAIPAFTRYVKRSKTAEAVGNVTTIANLLVSSLNAMPGPRRRAARLTAVPATPSPPPSTERYAADPSRWATAPWQRVGFSLDAAHYYQYRVDVDGRCYVVVAEGDLDGDGARSRFSRRVCPGADGAYSASELQTADELE